MQGPATSFTSVLQCRQDIEAQGGHYIFEVLVVPLQSSSRRLWGSERPERTDRRRGYPNGCVDRAMTTFHGTRICERVAWSHGRARRVGVETPEQMRARCARCVPDVNDDLACSPLIG
jgi:hypothetical protein